MPVLQRRRRTRFEAPPPRLSSSTAAALSFNSPPPSSTCSIADALGLKIPCCACLAAQPSCSSCSIAAALGFAAPPPRSSCSAACRSTAVPDTIARRRHCQARRRSLPVAADPPGRRAQDAAVSPHLRRRFRPAPDDRSPRYALPLAPHQGSVPRVTADLLRLRRLFRPRACRSSSRLASATAAGSEDLRRTPRPRLPSSAAT